LTASSLFDWLLIGQIVQGWNAGIVAAVSYDANDDKEKIGRRNRIIDTTGRFAIHSAPFVVPPLGGKPVNKSQ
jgi:hypothetical protein